MFAPISLLILLVCKVMTVMAADDVVMASSRITNGVLAEKREFPFMAGISIPSGSNSWNLCGGSLIDETHVLTAAHCLYGVEKENVLKSIVIINRLTLTDEDEEDKDQPGGLRGVVDFKIHPNYDSRLWFNDIAILTLNQTVTNVPVVKLPSRATVAQPILVGRTGTIIGWGQIVSDGGGTGSSYLLKTEVKVINLIQCSVRLRIPAVIGAHICTASAIDPADGQLGNGPCQGDSGGPFVVGGVQVGIISGGSPKAACGSPGSAGLHTSVGFYLHWIKANSNA